MKERLTTEDKVDLSLECVRFLHVTLTALYIIVEIVVIYKKIYIYFYYPRRMVRSSDNSWCLDSQL